MNEVVAWAKKNAQISHESDTMIVGRYNERRFRIFLDKWKPEDSWAGVIQTGGMWSAARACYNLDEFLEAVCST